MVTGELLGFIAGGVGISSNIPQILSIIRLKHTEGISRTTWTLAYLYSSFWFGYGIKTHSPSQDFANGFTILCAMWILWAIMGSKASTYAFLVALPLTVITVSLSIPLEVLSPILFGSAAISFTQVLKSWQSKRRKISTAVSLHMLFMNEFTSTLWLTYALLGGRTIVVITTMLALVSNGIIIFFELQNKYENDKNKQEA